MQKSEDVSNAAIKLHDELTAAGLDVLLYDEKARLGGMLADLDLIGIPHRIVIGDRGLKEDKVEYKKRDAEESQDIAIDEIVGFLQNNQM
jgi:prolyl-tRNA synthetase